MYIGNGLTQYSYAVQPSLGGLEGSCQSCDVGSLCSRTEANESQQSCFVSLSYAQRKLQDQTCLEKSLTVGDVSQRECCLPSESTRSAGEQNGLNC